MLSIEALLGQPSIKWPSYVDSNVDVIDHEQPQLTREAHHGAAGP